MFRKRLRLFLTHTSPITSSDEASRLRYISSLLKDWYNIVHIKSVVSDVMSAVDQYNFPNLSPRYGNAYLSHLSRTFNSTSTDVTTEDELDDLEDGSTHFSNGKRHCHTCGGRGQWHTPQDCPAASRACRQCSKMGHLAKACPIGTYLTIPLLTLAEIPNQANQHSAYGSDTDSKAPSHSQPPIIYIDDRLIRR